MVKLVVTVFYVGFLPYAPGTFGSIVAVFLGYWIQSFGGFPLLISLIAIFFFLGWIMTHRYISKDFLTHDPQEIVIDELVGQWVAYLPISFYIWMYELSIFSKSWVTWLPALILFRIFDIGKPWPVSWADKKKSSLGVMLDDFLAGVYAACTIIILILIVRFGSYI